MTNDNHNFILDAAEVAGNKGCKHSKKIILVSIIIGMIIGAVAFSDTVTETRTKTEVIEQKVEFYEIDSVDIQGRCYDSFGDSVGNAENVRSTLQWESGEKEMRGDLGKVVFRTPLDFDISKAECPDNATDVEVRIKSVEYTKKIYQSGNMIGNSTETAHVYETIQAHRSVPEERWDERGYYGIEDEIYEDILNR